jgi:4-hydroxy-tetrahydrodipicolinate synthase
MGTEQTLAAPSERISGVLAPVVTPFGTDFAPDGGRLISHSRWLISQGVGLALFGTTSEANSLALEERTALLEEVVGRGVDPTRVLAGTGCCSLTDSVRLTAHAVKLGCAGVLMLPPFYYKGVSDEGLFRHFAEVIERVGDPRLRLYLYNIPPIANVAITLPLIERLLTAYPGVVAGAKDSSGDWNNTRAYLDNFAAHGFDVFPGSETFLLRGMRHGGAGCISATANVNPGPIARLFATWQAVDAQSQQRELDEIRGVFAKYPIIPALKAAIAHYSWNPAWITVRPPLIELADDQSVSLLNDLDEVGFTMPGLERSVAAS